MNVEIIAELGQNHNGSIKTAEELIKAAYLAGADTVKFQKYDLSVIPDKPYNSCNSYGETYLEHKKHLDLSIEELKYLRIIAKSYKLKFLITPVDSGVVNDVYDVEPSRVKIASCRFNDDDLLSACIDAGYDKIIMSTGMNNHEDIKSRCNCLFFMNPDIEFAFMHCVSQYPAPVFGMRMIQELSNYGIAGFSSHDIEPMSCPVAVSLGAEIIEKHLTLDKNMRGTDHAASLEPGEFKEVVELIRKTENWINSERTVLESERQMSKKLSW